MARKVCEHVWISAKICPKMVSDLPLSDNDRKTPSAYTSAQSSVITVKCGAEECEHVGLKTG